MLSDVCGPNAATTIVFGHITHVVADISSHRGKFRLDIAIDDGRDELIVDLGADWIQREMGVTPAEFAAEREAGEAQGSSDWMAPLNKCGDALSVIGSAFFTIEPAGAASPGRAAGEPEPVPTVIAIQSSDPAWVTASLQRLEAARF